MFTIFHSQQHNCNYFPPKNGTPMSYISFKKFHPWKKCTLCHRDYPWFKTPSSWVCPRWALKEVRCTVGCGLRRNNQWVESLIRSGFQTEVQDFAQQNAPPNNRGLWSHHFLQRIRNNLWASSTHIWVITGVEVTWRRTASLCGDGGTESVQLVVYPSVSCVCGILTDHHETGWCGRCYKG